ncbi:EFTUD2 isoform 17, partial [Pan troglodytes]
VTSASPAPSTASASRWAPLPRSTPTPLKELPGPWKGKC